MSHTLHVYLTAGGIEEPPICGCLAVIIPNLARFKTNLIAYAERLDSFSYADVAYFIQSSGGP